MRSILFVALVALAQYGCSSETDAGSEFRADIADLQTETAQHASQCAAADSIPAMTTEMTRHDSMMPSLLEQMDGSFSRMSHCYMRAMSDMQQMMASIHDGDAQHRARMTAPTSLSGLRAECASYTDGTLEILQYMKGMMRESGMHCMM